MTPAELDALAHGLMDYDAHRHSYHGLHRPEVRAEALELYRAEAREFLVSRLQEAEIARDAG